jgi:hypothetical protein
VAFLPVTGSSGCHLRPLRLRLREQQKITRVALYIIAYSMAKHGSPYGSAGFPIDHRRHFKAVLRRPLRAEESPLQSNDSDHGTRVESSLEF